MQKLLELSKEAALQAGAYLRSCRKRVEKEKGKDIKLEADKKSEEIILSVLSKANIPILSEENGQSGELSDTYFVVDPLDGSMNLSKGIKELTCVSIALMKRNRPMVGVVYRYWNDELFWGIEGIGAFCNDVQIHTSAVKEVSRAVLATGFPVFRDYSDQSLHVFISQVQNFKKIRMLGAAALMGSFVATGRIDAYMEENIMLWDVAAATAIVRAAGGETELEINENNKCNCRLFANKELMEDYRKANAQSI